MIEIPAQSKRENFSVPLAFTSFLEILLSMALIFTGKPIYGIPSLLLGLYLFKLSISWFFNLKRHFEFESETGTVNLITFNNKTKTIKQIATSDEIEAFAVNGIKNFSRGRSYWAYQILMILKNGQIIPVSEIIANKKHSEVEKKAEKLASHMNCSFFSSPHQVTLEFATHPGRVEISSRPWKLLDTFRWQGLEVLYSLAFFAAIILFIIGLVVTLS